MPHPARPRRPRLAVVPLEDRTTPAVAFALSGTNLLSFDTTNPTATQTTAITGVTAGETLVGIDFRPQNGLLYGLGVNATADTATLYAISTRTGVAGIVGTAGAVAFTTDGSTTVDLPDPATVGYGVDFNPAVDRFRVVAGALNFRVDPNSGAPVDGNNGGGVTTGTNPDGPVNGGTTTVDATAYTNNQPNNGGVTTQYTLDSVSNALYLQNPPNAGTQTLGQTVTLGGGTLDFTTVNGFDVPAGVNAPASNAAVTTGSAFAVLNVGGTTGLYSINLVNGQATLVGTVGTGTTAVSGLAIQSDLGGIPAIALSADGTTLLRFNTATPGTVTTQAISGVTAGETLVGLDLRPQTGQLYGLGVNATADTGTLYRIDPQTGALTAVGSASQIAFAEAGGSPVDLQDPATTGYGFDFNPTVDRIRVVTGNGRNFRLNPNTGAAVDGDFGGSAGAVAGVNPDGDISGLPVGSTGVSATAYLNSFGQSLVGGITTQYTLDATSNRLSIQNPPNAGTQTSQRPITLGGNPLDFTEVSGFDVPAGVMTDTANAFFGGGRGFAALTVGGVTGLYSLNLGSGAATALGGVGAGSTPLAGLALGDAPAGTVTLSSATYSESEIGFGVQITLTRTSANGMASVNVTAVPNGTFPGWDLSQGPITATFADGSTTATVFVTFLDDTVDEPDQTFSVVLSDPTDGAVLGTLTTATVTIVDNDPPNGAVSLSQANYSVAEGAGALAVTLNRTGGSGGAGSVYVELTAVTAGASDLTLTPILVNFADGQTTATVSIPITDDSLVETDETFNLRLIFFTRGLQFGPVLQAVGTIVDNDGPDGEPSAPPTVVTGVGNRLTVTNPDDSTRVIDPYPGFTGGFTVASGDVTGDGVADIVTGAGAGGGSHVKVFDGATGALVRSFFAYTGFLGGVSVAAGDVDGDGAADIVTGAGLGGGSHVKVFSGRDGSLLRSFFAFDGFLGGVNVAAGDVDGDGRADLVAGAGLGGNGHVKVFSGRDGSLLRSFFAFDGFTGGVFVAAGDLDGDGRAEIVTGSGAGSPGHVKVFSGADNALLASFFAYEGFLGGARVAVSDVDGDGVKEIVTGAGPGGGPHVKVFGLDGLLKSSSFAGAASDTSGVFVG